MKITRLSSSVSFPVGSIPDQWREPGIDTYTHTFVTGRTFLRRDIPPSRWPGSADHEFETQPIFGLPGYKVVTRLLELFSRGRGLSADCSTLDIVYWGGLGSTRCQPVAYGTEQRPTGDKYTSRIGMTNHTYLRHDNFHILGGRGHFIGILSEFQRKIGESEY